MTEGHTSTFKSSRFLRVIIMERKDYLLIRVNGMTRRARLTYSIVQTINITIHAAVRVVIAFY